MLCMLLISTDGEVDLYSVSKEYKNLHFLQMLIINNVFQKNLDVDHVVSYHMVLKHAQFINGESKLLELAEF